MPAETQADHHAVGILAPQSTGGPDDYGYTWDDGIPFYWEEAQGGTDTGLSQGSWGASVTGTIDLGFSFKFYENTYTQLYISSAGAVGFDASSLAGQTRTAYIPIPTSPNNFIAPYLAPLLVNAGSYTGHVYYLRGGAAPSRYFVVQWNQAADSIGGQFTFQVVLYEDGIIDFNYLSMTQPNGWYCGTASGIEDAQGLDGLAYIQANVCKGMLSATGKTVRFYRPAPSARVSLSPKIAGTFTAPGNVVWSSVVVQNNGELGTDTYDVSTLANWPVTLYQEDGLTPLADTNGDGLPDTGPITQGSSRTVVVKTAVPLTAVLGQSSSSQLVVRSSLDTSKVKTAAVRLSVPAFFAQSYVKTGQSYIGLYRVGQQTVIQTTAGYGYGAAVATAPGGNIVQVWNQGRLNGNNQWVNELYYAVLDRFGNSVQAATKLTDLSVATVQAFDANPAIAIAPNGNIAIVWYRDLWDSSNSTNNYNIYYMIINRSGSVVMTATNLTNNTQWGSWNTPNVPSFYSLSVAVAANSRFVLVWQPDIYNGSSWQDTIWYAVLDSEGGTIKPPTQFSTTGSTCDYGPNAAPLADGTVFLSYANCGQISLGQLDSDGNALVGPLPLASSYGYVPDAVQVPNGNIVLAWLYWNSSSSRYNVQYAVLNASLGVVKSATNLSSGSPVGDDSVSVTYFGNRAILTWGDACCGYQPNLYYALLDGVGNVLTPPMIFASDNVYYALSLASNGEGNTFLYPDPKAYIPTLWR